MVYDIIHHTGAYSDFFHLGFIRVLRPATSANLYKLIDKITVKETRVCTTAVNDVMCRVFD